MGSANSSPWAGKESAYSGNLARISWPLCAKPPPQPVQMEQQCEQRRPSPWPCVACRGTGLVEMTTASRWVRIHAGPWSRSWSMAGGSHIPGQSSHCAEEEEEEGLRRSEKGRPLVGHWWQCSPFAAVQHSATVADNPTRCLPPFRFPRPSSRLHAEVAQHGGWVLLRIGRSMPWVSDDRHGLITSSAIVRSANGHGPIEIVRVSRKA